MKEYMAPEIKITDLNVKDILLLSIGTDPGEDELPPAPPSSSRPFGN